MKLASSLALLWVSVAATSWSQGDGTITGRVFDTAGAPVAAVKVDIVELGKAYMKRMPYGRLYQTGPDGAFRIEHVQFGTYGITTKKEEDGYPDSGQGMYNKNLKSPTVTISAASPNRDVTVILEPRAGVLDASSVVDAVTGANVNAAVTIRREDNGVWMRSSTADKQILIPSVTPLTVEVGAPGYATWYYPGTPDVSKAATLSLQPGQKIEIRVALQPSKSSSASQTK